MKDFKKYVARKDEIDFSLQEKSGHIVYVPAKGKFDQVPGISRLDDTIFTSLQWLIKEGTVHRGLYGGWAVLFSECRLCKINLSLSLHSLKLIMKYKLNPTTFVTVQTSTRVVVSDFRKNLRYILSK